MDGDVIVVEYPTDYETMYSLKNENGNGIKDYEEEYIVNLISLIQK